MNNSMKLQTEPVKISLAICIPTYNRAQILKKNVINLIEIIREYDIPIYITDNASEDDTEHVVTELMEEYKHIYFYHNESNLGMDKNLELALKACKEEYAWFLGDDDTIVRDISEILRLLEQVRPTILVLGENVVSLEGCYVDPHKVLNELVYEMTWMSGLIISKEMISKMNFKRFFDTWFPHTGAIMEYISYNQFTLYYLKNKWVSRLTDQVSYAGKILEVYAKGWTDLIIMLPQLYTLDEKLNILRKRTKKGGVLSNRALLSLRAVGVYNYKELIKYKNYIFMYNKSPFLVLAFISVMPKYMLVLLRKSYLKIKQCKHQTKNERL